MSELKNIAHKWFDAFNVHDIEMLLSLYAENAEHYSPKLKVHQPETNGLIKGKVVRYEWDAIESLNFVCYEALDGGASRSMRMDTLGKNFASHLLRMELETQ